MHLIPLVVVFCVLAVPLQAQDASSVASAPAAAQPHDVVDAIQPRLDHLMWFVDDLGGARALLADTLGFTVSHGGRMSWGAENALVWFEDDSYLEPLYLNPGSSVDYWAPFTAKHQGGTSFGLRVPSAQAAHDYFQARGLRVSAPYSATFDGMGPVSEMPDEMWRVLSSAGTGYLADLIFWIEYTDAWWDLHRRHPEIDPRRGTGHANTARGVAHHQIATFSADLLASQFERYGFTVGEMVDLPHLRAAGREVRVASGSIWLVQPRWLDSPVLAFLRQRGEGVMGLGVAVADLDTAQRTIEARSGWSLERFDAPGGPAFAIPAARARGLRLEFVAPQ